MTAPVREFSDEQILETVADAIANRDLEVVPGLLTVLALQNPALAQRTLDAIKAALAVAGEGHQ